MYNREYTPEWISELKPNEIFVFGSNLEGLHKEASARIALERFGAIWGQGVGLQGQSYAIPMVEGYIALGIESFIHFAALHPQYRFLVSRLEKGTSYCSADDIAELFVNALELENVILPGKYVQVAKEFECWIETCAIRGRVLDSCNGFLTSAKERYSRLTPEDRKKRVSLYSQELELRIGSVYRMKIPVTDGGLHFYVNQYVDFFNEKGQYVYSYGVQFDEEEGSIIDDWTTNRISVTNDVEYKTKLDSNNPSLCTCTDTYYTRDGHAVVYDGITEIPDGCFYELTNLKSVSLPQSVIKIGNEAFYGCWELTSIVIPDAVTIIGRNAFSGCGIKSVFLPRGLKYIDFYAFDKSLESIIVPVDAAERLTSMLPFHLQDLVVVDEDEH